VNRYFSNIEMQISKKSMRKMLNINIFTHQGYESRLTLSFHLKPVRTVTIKETNNSKCLSGCEGKKKPFSTDGGNTY
jgi:hypothetical protein